MLNASHSRLFHSPRKASLYQSDPSSSKSNQYVYPRSPAASSHTKPTYSRAIPTVTNPQTQAHTQDPYRTYSSFRMDQVSLSYSSSQVQRFTRAPDSCCDLTSLLGYVEEAFFGEDDLEIDIDALVEELINVVEHPQSQLSDSLTDAVYELIDTLESLSFAEDIMMNQLESTWEALGMLEEQDHFESDDHSVSHPYTSMHSLNQNQALSITQSITIEFQINIEMYAYSQAPKSSDQVIQLLSNDSVPHAN